jgi:hypothetical protein
MSNAETGRMARWATRPLCTRYLVVNFGLQTAAVSDGSECRSLSFCWAMGTLSDGEAEILGWWQNSQPEPIGWSAISTDLTARGVKRIRMLVDSSGALDSPGCIDGPGFGGGPVTHPMSAALQRRVAEASARMRRVQASLSRAVLRHGAFADTESAAALVDSELQRLDRGFWSRPDVAARRSSQAHMPLLVAA